MDVKELILKHLQGELSTAEQIELDSWISASDSNRILFNEINDPSRVALVLNKIDQLDEDKVWQRLLAHKTEVEMGFFETDISVNRDRRNRISAFRWRAAAAIVICISFGTYFLIQNRTGPLAIPVAINADVAPGGNRAVLTLSNGSQIILDSAHKGVLAKQGNVNVTKTDSGRLVYNASIEKANNNSTPSEISYNTLSTPRGGQYQLSLSDGTKVWLNAASSIVYPTAFVGKERKVTITGEVYFEVRHNAKQPFRVKTSNQVIEDIGTAFNVNAYEGENAIRTTLLEGSVKVISENTKRSEVIKPGQQVELSTDKMTVINHVNTNEVISWKEGSFDFESADLKTILRQFSRWYGIDVVYEVEPKSRKYFVIVKRSNSLQKVLEMMQDNNINYKIEGNKLIVKSN